MIKRTIGLVLALIFILSTLTVILPAFAADDNILVNGGFEHNTAGWWLRNDWNGGMWERKAGVGVDGSYGMQAVSTVASPTNIHNIGMYYTMGSGPSMRVSKGMTYELSFDVFRGEGVDSKVYLDVVVGSEAGYFKGVYATKNGEWEHCAVSFVAQSDEAVYYRIVCNALATGEEVYVDNVCVKSYIEKKSVELINNGSFEEKDLADWCFENTEAGGWQVAEDKGYNGGTGLSALSTAKESDTQQSFSLYYAQEGGLELEPGETYELTYNVYRAEGVQAEVFIDDEGGKISALNATKNGEWETVTGRFIAEEGGYSLRLVCSGLSEGEEVFADDISLRKIVKKSSAKGFPYGTVVNNPIEEYTLATQSTSAQFKVAKNAMYISSLVSLKDNKEYITENIEVPFVSIINGDFVEWVYLEAGINEIEKGRELRAVYTSADGSYRLDAVWTARSGEGPLEYNQYITGIDTGVSVAYGDAVSANFRFETQGETTLYRFNRSRINDGSDNENFSKGTLPTKLTAGASITSTVRNHHSPVAAILPYQMLDVDGERGIYYGHYWAFGQLMVRMDTDGDVAVTTYLSDSYTSAIKRAQGETVSIPGFFMGAYAGDIDEGSNEMKHWFWEHKITRSLYENEDEPRLSMNDNGSTVSGIEWVFDNYPDFADYVNVIKIDYNWPLPSGYQPRQNIAVEDKWLPDAKNYASDKSKTGIYMGVWEQIKKEAANDSVEEDVYLSLYMADTYLGTDIGTKEGRELQLNALKERFRPETNDYGMGYDYWRSDFEIEDANDYDDHEGMLYILDSMIEYSDEFRYEHCAGGGTLKDFTTLERMAWMTTEDTGRAFNHRMALYANTYMICPVQLKGDINLMYPSRDFGAATGYGPIIGRHEDGSEIMPYESPEYVVYALRTGMLGASMVCFSRSALGMNNNYELIKQNYGLYKQRHRAILRDCDVYHILPAPTGWNWADWDGIMYYNEKVEQGVVQLFKENETAPDEKTIVLKGLDEKVNYTLEFIDRPEQNCVMSGEQLMSEGIHVTGMTQRFDTEIIYITPNNVLAESVEVEGKTELKAGESTQLTATVMPDNTTDKSISWSTSDESIAEVDENGMVKAKRIGSVTITATAQDGSLAAGSIDISIKGLNAPAAVKAVSQGAHSLKISWTACADAEGYKVYRADDQNGEYTAIYTTKDATKLYVNNLNRVTGKTYYYKVCALDEVEGELYEGELSMAASGKAIPSKPRNVKTASVSATTIKVSWDKVAGAKGYKLYASTTGKTGSFYVSYTTNDPEKTSVNVLKRVTGNTYYFKVRAISEYEGATVSGTLSAAVTGKAIPATPVVTISKASATSIRNKWKAVYGADGYEVYRSLSGKTGTFYLQKRTEYLSYANTALKKGRPYYYKVRAYTLVDGKRVYGNFSTVKLYTL